MRVNNVLCTKSPSVSTHHIMVSPSSPESHEHVTLSPWVDILSEGENNDVRLQNGTAIKMSQGLLTGNCTSVSSKNQDS